MGTYFSEIWIEILYVSFKKMQLKKSAAKMTDLLLSQVAYVKQRTPYMVFGKEWLANRLNKSVVIGQIDR